jgi:hypothetical protein
MKIVIYTAIFGKKIGLFKQPDFKNTTYICYTDQDLTSKHWSIEKVKPWFKDPTRNNRYVKILPHLFFKDYDLSIYIDANYLVIGDISNLINEVCKHHLFTCFNHDLITGDTRNCAYKELNHILHLGKQRGVFKDDPETMKRQMKKYRAEGYPENNGLIRGSVLIRKHNNSNVINFMEQWWSELNTGSRRDQLSCNYAAWKTNFTINYLPGNGVRGNKWFFNLGSNRSNFSKKIAQYKIKRFLSIYKFN